MEMDNLVETYSKAKMQKSHAKVTRTLRDLTANVKHSNWQK